MFRLPNALESLSNHNGGQLTKITELLHSDASLFNSWWYPVPIFTDHSCLFSAMLVIEQ